MNYRRFWFDAAVRAQTSKGEAKRIAYPHRVGLWVDAFDRLWNYFRRSDANLMVTDVPMQFFQRQSTRQLHDYHFSHDTRSSSSGGVVIVRKIWRGSQIMPAKLLICSASISRQGLSRSILMNATRG